VSPLIENLLNAMFSAPQKFFKKFLKNYLRKNQKEIVFIGEVSDLISRIKREVEMSLSNDEASRIYWAVKSTEKIDGEIAEVGVYRGGSARLICEVKGDKNLYLFDTFEGLPKPHEIYDDGFHEGGAKESLENVQQHLVGYRNIYFYKGVFPDTAQVVKDKHFSFVHFDVDLYKSTLDCLKFFYPRVNKGGIIISHDYPSVNGVKKAFDEFFKDKPEPIIRVSYNQCLIVKIE